MKKINRESGITPIIIMIIVLLVVGVGGGMIYVRNNNKGVVQLPSPTPASTDSLQSTPTELLSPSSSVEVMISDQKSETKEFSMNSWYEMKDGKPSTNFSLKEIKVKKGDMVKIKVTNTKGNHDFSLDEYNIKKPTPLNEEVVIEFKADKVGSFKYYCSMADHRMMGQEGTLIVE